MHHLKAHISKHQPDPRVNKQQNAKNSIKTSYYNNRNDILSNLKYQVQPFTLDKRQRHIYKIKNHHQRVLISQASINIINIPNYNRPNNILQIQLL